MSTQPVTSKEYFRALTILHASLISGQILMVAILYFGLNLAEKPVMRVTATGQSAVYIIGALTIVGVLASGQLFGMRLRKLREVKDLKEKMTGYRSASVLRYMLLEAPSIAGILGYFFTNNPLLLIFTGLLALLLLAYRPTRKRAITDLELNPGEQALLDKPDAIIADL